MKDWFVKNFILVSILFIAALLRLSFLTAYPPGLTNDEVEDFIKKELKEEYEAKERIDNLLLWQKLERERI